MFRPDSLFADFPDGIGLVHIAKRAAPVPETAVAVKAAVARYNAFPRTQIFTPEVVHADDRIPMLP